MKALLVLVALFVSVAYSQGPGSTGPCSAIALPGPYLTPLSVFGSNIGAQPNYTCGYSYSSGIVWFSISPGSSSNVTVRTCSDNTNFDTFIYVLSGTCRNSTCVGINDDGCSSGHSSYTWISSGDIYLVGVGGYSGNAGKFQLTVSENPLKNGSVCQSAVNIPGPYSPPVMIYGNNNQSIGANICSLTSGNYIDWYAIYPAKNDEISLSTCFRGTTFDTTISVFTGNCQYLNCTLYSDDNCTTSGPSYASGLSFIATSTMYYVAVAGYSSNRGNYQFQISANSNNCSQLAEPVKTSDGNIQVFGTTVGSPTLPSGIPSCGTSASFSPAVWYNVTGSGTATVSSCSSYTDFDTVIYVYQGACSNLQCVTSNDDSNCVAYSHASTVSFTVSPNTNYWVVLTGYAGASGNYILSFTFN